MRQTVNVKGVAGQCPACGHPPIRHVEDGTGATCIVCLAYQEKCLEAVALGIPLPGWPGCKMGSVCTLKFEFKLSKAEREQAQKADKGAYDQKDTCANCFCYWMQHEGYLCPTGDSTFVLLLDSQKPFLITK